MTGRPDGVGAAIVETAADLERLGLLDRPTLEKITLRHMAPGGTPAWVAPHPHEIRRIREEARMSQAVFARHLNLTVGYVSQLERGTRRPSGSTLVLLDVMRRKGIDAIL